MTGIGAHTLCNRLSSARIMAIAGLVAGALAAPAFAIAPPGSPDAGRGEQPPSFVSFGSPLVATDPFASDQFGWSVALDGDTAVVGAWLEDNERGHNAGAAYLFHWTGGNWVQIGKFTAPDGADEDRFGQSVAIHKDLIVIGACMADAPGAVDAGAAYVFRRTGDQWSFDAKLVASDAFRVDHFSRHIAISDIGVAISAPREERPGGLDQGAVYFFQRYSDGWREKTKLIAPTPGSGDCFGFRFAMDNTTLAVGSQYNDAPHSPSPLFDAGSVDVFTFQAGEWVHSQLLRASDVAVGANFGSSLALGSGLLIVGAERAGVGNVQSGAAYVFGRDSSGQWQQTAKLAPVQPAPDDYFGSTVAISGPTILVAAEKADLGAIDSGAVQPFTYSTVAERWLPGAAFNSGLNQGGEFFGTDLAFSHGLILAAAPFVDLPGALDAGATFAFAADQDCNNDGMGDLSQIMFGKLSDVNGNGIPDMCECLADWDRSGAVSSADMNKFVNDWFLDQQTGTLNADIDANGVSNAADVTAYINAYFEGCV